MALDRAFLSVGDINNTTNEDCDRQLQLLNVDLILNFFNLWVVWIL